MVVGDVGTNVGATTGFDTANVTGTIHSNPDTSTAVCAADLLVIYNYLNLLPHDIELLYPVQFGNRLVLTPHTYLLNAATAFNDTLYLNAENNPAGVFVIKINGALTTGTHATVKLINGAQAANVFWKVEGAVSINGFCQFKGTIISDSGAIVITTGAVLEGRAMTTIGALSTGEVNVTMTPGCSATPLSVNWLYFTGKPVQKDVILEWATTNEVNNGFFTIEESTDGRSFRTLATVAAASASAAEHKYSYTHMQAAGLTYYRISQTDLSGARNYFRTIQVGRTEGINVKQFTARGVINLKVSGASPANGSITLFNMEGKKMETKKIMLTKEETTYSIDHPSQKGIYLIYMESNGRKIYEGKIMSDL
jgi:hypothetical protein